MFSSFGYLDSLNELQVGELNVFMLALFTLWILSHGLQVYGVSEQASFILFVGGLPNPIYIARSGSA